MEFFMKAKKMLYVALVGFLAVGHAHKAAGMQRLKKYVDIAKKAQHLLRKPIVQAGVGLVLYTALYDALGKKIITKHDATMQEIFSPDNELTTQIAKNKALVTWTNFFLRPGTYATAQATLISLESAHNILQDIVQETGATEVTWFVGKKVITHAKKQQIALTCTTKNPHNPLLTGAVYHELRHAQSVVTKKMTLKTQLATMPALYYLSFLIPATRVCSIGVRFAASTLAAILVRAGLARHEEIIADAYALAAIKHDPQALSDMRDFHLARENDVNAQLFSNNIPLFKQLPATVQQTIGHMLIDPLHPRALNSAYSYQRALNNLMKK
jgi:hypothetical protein